MLHRIEVDVVDMAFQVGIIANGMFPITTLPNSPLASGNLAQATLHVAGKPARNPLLIRLQRSGKSASPCGSDQTACKWSGNTQIAMVWNGYRS